jgi:hypothetical protein
MNNEPEAVCWLWPEKDGVRWWTHSDTGFMSISLPNQIEISEQISNLRHSQQKPLSTFLETELYEVITQQLEKAPKGLRLLLTEDLPPEWHRFPFEWLHLDDGRNLQGRVIVERYVPRTAAPPKFPMKPQIAILNLLPQKERSYFKGLGQLDLVSDILQEKNKVERFLSRNNLSAFSTLCLIVHGSEKPLEDAPPFCLIEGENKKNVPWELPTEQGFPPLVLLLVCGSDQGNLVDYAKILLQKGVQTVLAPIGQLDAAPMRLNDYNY